MIVPPNILSSLFLGFYVVSSHAAAFVEGGVTSSDPASHFEPQVAMVCNSRNQYHAQYMDENGRWVTDTTSETSCLKDKVDILKFCKRMYPHRQITNIVEAPRFFKVPNFCRLGHTKCKSSIFVKPFRCLEGSFQSDALLVPEGCLFDHIHNQSRCWEFDEWNSTADQACRTRELSLKAFAMLLPCGIDVFSGVEFVCCPKSYKNHGKAHSMEMEEPIALPQIDRHAAQTPSGSSALPPSHVDATTPTQEVDTRDEYFSRFDPHEEHDAFRRAEQRLEEKHREKVSKIMKEWSELEERYQDLHEQDPRGAEEFKHRMTQRFQQTVQAVEAENEAEKHQLTALHQQRIVAHINEMKREAMTCYTRALSASMPNTHKVQKCLQKLLRALNKDRHHTVSHFKHLLNSDYEAADRERDSTLQHLADLSRMMNQSLNMLARKPDLYAKIGHLMHEYANALISKDITPPELTPIPPRVKTEEEDSEEDYEDEEDSEEDDDDDDEDEEEDDEDEEDGDEDSDEDADDEDLAEEDKDDVESNSATATEEAEPVNPSAASALTGSSSSSSPDEDLSPLAHGPSASSSHQVEEPHVAHAQHHVFSQDQSGYSVTREESASESRGVYFTLAFAGVALMGAMIFGIVLLRRRNSRNPQNQGFMEVDQAVTPEERHVSNMQVNGYENPTYKYFEQK